MSPVRFVILFLVVVAAAVAASVAQAPDLNQPPVRASEPIVLKGSDFGDWSAPANQTAKVPLTDIFSCGLAADRDTCAHNHYEPPEVDTGDKRRRDHHQ